MHVLFHQFIMNARRGCKRGEYDVVLGMREASTGLMLGTDRFFFLISHSALEAHCTAYRVLAQRLFVKILNHGIFALGLHRQCIGPLSVVVDVGLGASQSMQSLKLMIFAVCICNAWAFPRRIACLQNSLLYSC